MTKYDLIMADIQCHLCVSFELVSIWINYALVVYRVPFSRSPYGMESEDSRTAFGKVEVEIRGSNDNRDSDVECLRT
jgi:hypothetical protein